MSSAAAAHWYANRGWPVFPCRERGKAPLTTHGLKDASTDHGVIDKWWTQHPRANLALVSGKPSGWFALDVDGGEGAASLAELERVHSALPDTVEQTTARGRHLLFALPPDVEIKNSAGKLGPGLDIRADGGYIIVAPSVHPSGTPYRWKDGRKPSDRQPAAPPAWLVDRLIERPSNKPGHATTRDETTIAYAQTALDGELSALMAAREGQRNDALNRAAYNIGTLVGADVLDLSRAQEGLMAAGLSIGLARQEVERTVESGLKAGIAEPRDIPFTRAPAGRVGDRVVAASPIPPPTDADWPTLDPAARHGFVGRMLDLIEPQTEADPVALIGQFLSAVGIAIGKFANFAVEADRHYGNLFVALVGETAKARKGTSWAHVRKLFEKAADPGWPERIGNGLSTGEGLIFAVRDPVKKLEEIRDANKKVIGDEMVTVDAGEPDKRMLIVESELAGPLKVMTREGNTLSPILRSAWDGTPLRTMTKSSPLRSQEPHIGIVAHVTRDELLRHITATEAANGLGNRFLWLCVRRSKMLPEGGHVDELALTRLTDELRGIVGAARNAGEIKRDAEATAIWSAVYRKLTEGRPGLLGAMIGRADAQVVRLSLLYALLDKSPVIRREHLMAALAFWEYSEASARYIFGDSLGDPVADTILGALRVAPDGLTRSQISSQALKGHRDTLQIDRALKALEAQRLARKVRQPTGGRDVELWTAVR